MKKVFLLIAGLTACASAFDKTTWNTAYTLGTVRMNANNWIGFTVVPKQTTTSGNIVSDQGAWFGIAPTNPRYATVQAMLLTAKATGRTIAFCPCNGGFVANTGSTVWDIGSGVDLE